MELPGTLRGVQVLVELQFGAPWGLVLGAQGGDETGHSGVAVLHQVGAGVLVPVRGACEEGEEKVAVKRVKRARRDEGDVIFIVGKNNGQLQQLLKKHICTHILTFNFIWH